MNVYRTVLAYLKKKSLVAIKPWGTATGLGNLVNHKFPKSEEQFRQEHTQTFDKDTHASLFNYGFKGHHSINKYLRTGETSRPEEVEKHVSNIDKAMGRSPLKSDVVLWRGVKINDAKNHAVVKKLLEVNCLRQDNNGVIRLNDTREGSNLKGFTFSEPSYVSTSLNRKIAEQFVLNDLSIIFKIKVTVGTQAIYMPSIHYIGINQDEKPDLVEGTGHDMEAEVLLDRGLTFRIDQVMAIKNQLLVIVDVV